MSTQGATTGDVNPLKSDPELVGLLKKLDKVKKYKSFQRWKSKFLDRLETFLFEAGMDPADQSATTFSKLLQSFVKRASKVKDFIDQGDLGENKKTVKAALALSEMCKSLTSLADETQALIPSTSQDEKKRGFTKFHLGAVLIRQNFYQYITMKAIEDILAEIGTELKTVADRQQHDLFAWYKLQVERFCDVMADLNLYEVMMKCLEFQEQPEEEESSSEEPITYAITIATPPGKLIKLQVEPMDTLGSIKEMIAADCGLEPVRQVMKLADGTELIGDDQTLESLGVKDGAALTVEPFRVPVTVNTVDGNSRLVMIDPSNYISDIKRQLEKETGMPAKNQRIFMNGEELNDGKTGADYGIKKGSVLDLEPKIIKISVEMPDGKTHQVEVSISDSSDAIKKKIENATGMPVSKQVLKMNGEELPSEGTVKSMGIQDGATLTVDIFKIPVTVNTMDGKKHEVMIDPSQYLSDIKRQLEKNIGLPAANQRLFMNGNELSDNGKTANDYGIKAGSVLDLEPKSIKITVEMPDGKTHTVEVASSDTSDGIKKKIENATGMAAPRQVLKMNGKVLPSDGTVKSMGIQDGSTISVDIFKVPVTVNTLDGKSHEIMIDPSQYLSDIKRQLEKDTGLPAANQRLFMHGDELADNGKTGADYGIKAGSVLDLEPKAINISVQMPDGKTHTVEVSPSDSSDTIKKKIESATGMAAPRQVLKMNGKKLPSDGTVKSMGIQDGSTISVDIFKVPVTVNTFDGKQIHAMVDPSQSLGDIKRQLERESGLPAKNQKLLMHGDELADDSKTAANYGIKSGSVLALEPKSIKVSAQMPDGKKHALELSSNDNCDGIKKKIEIASGLAAPRQVLRMDGKELPLDGQVLNMGIQDGSTIMVDYFTVPVTVNTMDGEKIKIMVEPSQPLNDLKSQLEKKTGIPSRNQRLSLHGDELVDGNKSATDHGLKAGSVLDLEPKTIKVSLDMPDGKNRSIEISPSSTSDEVKAKIAKETGMAADRQVLRFGDKEFPGGGKMAKQIGIKEGSTLSVGVFKIPITVRSAKDGKTYDLQVEPCASIDNVKELLSKSSGLDPKRQCLKFNEEELTKGRNTVSDSGIVAGSTLTLERIADCVIFVDIKCGTLFGVERDEVIEKGALTPFQNNKLDFSEAAKDGATRDKICQAMKDCPTLGVAKQVVVQATEVDDYELEEAENVKSKWGVSLKKREKNKKGEEFLFVDPKTGACGELSRQKYIDMGFITLDTSGKVETLVQREQDSLTYDKFVADIRKVFGIKFE